MSAPNQLSFLPDDYLERKAQRRANLVCATLFLLVSVGIGTSFALAERSLKRVEQRAAETDQQYAEAAKRIQQVQQMQERQRTMARQAELTAQLLEKIPRSFLLAEITNALPAGVSLLDLQLDSKLRKPKAETVPVGATAAEQRRLAREKRNQPSTPEAKQYDVTVRITGIAYTDVQVARYITSLNASRVLRDVNLVVSETLEPKEKDGGEVMRKFSLDMTLDTDAAQSIDNRPGTPAGAVVDLRASQAAADGGKR
jgi:Tfp pilus assembly protein PilN